MAERRAARAAAAAFGLALVASADPAAAHKVIAMAWVDGDRIEGEIAFSSGAAAEAGAAVEVFGPDGRPLGATVVEDGGLFSFTPTVRVDHRFVADLGAGHVADLTVPAEDLPAVLGGATAVALDLAAVGAAAAAERSAATAAAAAPAIDPAALEAMVRAAVAAEVRPLRRALAAFEERTRWHDVLGGVGYIFGLFGIAAYVAVWRRRRRCGEAGDA